MFSGQRNISDIEVLGFFYGQIAPTARLARHASLDDAEREEMEDLRRILREGYERWISQMQELERAGKRVLNSISGPFAISPAVHLQWLSYWRGEDATPNNNPTSPSSLLYWNVEQSPTTSPTIFPDALLRSHIPILLIRHPALAFPSTVRTVLKFLDPSVIETFQTLILRYRWLVIMYEWYRNDAMAPEPLILDADELMYNAAAVRELCERTGLAAVDIKYQWEREDIDVTYRGEDEYQNVLSQSTGVVSGKGSENVDVEHEFCEWIAEFGSDRAERIKNLVKDAMRDYLFLKERSITGYGASVQD